MDFMNFKPEIDMSMIWPANICHGFNQQLLFINVNTFWINGKKMRFVNFDFGVLLLEFRCPKLCLQNITQHGSQHSLSNTIVWDQPPDICVDVIQIREHVCFQSLDIYFFPSCAHSQTNTAERSNESRRTPYDWEFLCTKKAFEILWLWWKIWKNIRKCAYILNFSFFQSFNLVWDKMILEITKT